SAQDDRVSGFGSRVSGQDKDKDVTHLASSPPEPRNPKPETRLSNVSGHDKEEAALVSAPFSPETRNPKPETRLSAPETRLSNLDLIIHPVHLAATVQAVPYRLDNITGTVHLSGGKILLTDLAGKHGANSIVRISGSGSAEKTDWDLHVSAENVKVDDEFHHALPEGLASLVDSLKLTGTIAFEFPMLTIRDTPPDRVLLSRPAATTGPNSTPLDVDFAVKLALAKASVDVGVPMTGI